MRLAVTGGGTGGHVYPALEVAKLAASEGHEVCYFGSFRGIEGAACQAAGIPFVGFRSAPIPRLMSPAGLRNALQILTSSTAARKKLSSWKPNAVFSTGGYAASPILTASRSLRLPLVLHEQNSVPGRTNKMAAGSASRVCIVFEMAAASFGSKSVITGMPIRKALVDAAKGAHIDGRFFTLAYGGSQGSAPLNAAVLTMAASVGDDGCEWLQVTGPRHFEDAAKTMERILPPKNFSLKGFLSAEEITTAYNRADVAIVRSGCGTISELALFGIPAIYVPLPHSHANHQYFNAKSIEEIGGGSVLEQEALTPESLIHEWRSWRQDDDRRRAAGVALKHWSKPDATATVLAVVKEVANAPSG